jgi:hypothetical protein
MGDMDAITARTIELVQPLIKKPKLTPKLLGKPPFRFLHDVVTGIAESTGFAEGLYSADELNAGAIKVPRARPHSVTTLASQNQLGSTSMGIEFQCPLLRRTRTPSLPTSRRSTTMSAPPWARMCRSSSARCSSQPYPAPSSDPPTEGSNALQVVAGMEADKTNEFLQALAQAATDGGVNRQAALAAVLGVSSPRNTVFRLTTANLPG